MKKYTLGFSEGVGEDSVSVALNVKKVSAQHHERENKLDVLCVYTIMCV